MRVINPIGRNVDTVITANSLARACMCHTDTSFADANTSADECGHCGCDCGFILSDGNFTSARNTYRESSLG